MSKITPMVAALLSLGINNWVGAQHERPIKQCLHCSKEHDHNNSWCSAECCKADRKGI